MRWTTRSRLPHRSFKQLRHRTRPTSRFRRRRRRLSAPMRCSRRRRLRRCCRCRHVHLTWHGGTAATRTCSTPRRSRCSARCHLPRVCRGRAPRRGGASARVPAARGSCTCLRCRRSTSGSASTAARGCLPPRRTRSQGRGPQGRRQPPVRPPPPRPPQRRQPTSSPPWIDHLSRRWWRRSVRWT